MLNLPSLIVNLDAPKPDWPLDTQNTSQGFSSSFGI